VWWAEPIHHGLRALQWATLALLMRRDRAISTFIGIEAVGIEVAWMAAAGSPLPWPGARRPTPPWQVAGDPPAGEAGIPQPRRPEPEAALPVCDVLVVDDDSTIRDTVEEALTAMGYSVRTAENGAEALAQLRAVHPRIVLLDMRMPVLDGWGFAQTVAAQGLNLRIVVMTATTDARQWANEIGAEGYIAKPFDLEELLALVADYCGDG